MRRIAIAALVGGLLGALPALAQVEGEWAAAAETPQGKFEFSMTVAAADGGHTVTITDTPPAGAPAGPAMESTISDVMVDGDKLTFKRSINMGQGPLDLTYELTAAGDTMTGTAASSFGPVPITATRK